MFPPPITIIVTWIVPWEHSTKLHWSIYLTVSHSSLQFIVLIRCHRKVVWIQLLQVVMMELLSLALPSYCSRSLLLSIPFLSNPDEQMGRGEKKKGGMPACCTAITLSISPFPLLTSCLLPLLPSCPFLSCHRFVLLHLSLPLSIHHHLTLSLHHSILFSTRPDGSVYLSDHPSLTTTSQIAIKFTVYICISQTTKHYQFWQTLNKSLIFSLTTGSKNSSFISMLCVLCYTFEECDEPITQTVFRDR